MTLATTRAVRQSDVGLRPHDGDDRDGSGAARGASPRGHRRRPGCGGARHDRGAHGRVHWRAGDRAACSDAQAVRTVDRAQPGPCMPHTLHVSAIIAAGGRGARFGGAAPKQLLDTRRPPDPAAQRRGASAQRSLVHERRRGAAARPGRRTAPTTCRRLQAACDRRGRRAPPGFGGERLRRASPHAPTSCVIHDAARPLVSDGAHRAHHRGRAEHGAAIAALPRAATRSSAADADGAIVDDAAACARSTWRRRRRRSARDVLRDALALATTCRRDRRGDARRAGRPSACSSSTATRATSKITTPDDLAMAERLLGDVAAAAALRIGNGYDLHRLVAGRPLDPRRRDDSVRQGAARPLGCRRRLSRGHRRDPRRRGRRRHRPALSRTPTPRGRTPTASTCCAAPRRSSARTGFAIVNVDVVVIAQRPKLAPHVDAMRRNAGAGARHRRRAGQRQGQDQRRRRFDGRRRVDRRSRRGARARDR